MSTPHTRGNVTFVFKEIGPQDSPDRILFKIGCSPKPNGSRDDSNPPMTIHPVVLAAFTQPSEIARMTEAARSPSESELPLDTLLTDLGKAIKPPSPEVRVDPKKIPAAWELVEDCYIKTVSYYAAGTVYEVEARLNVTTTLGSEAYAAGDMIGNFRIWIPLRHFFRLRFQHDPDCCPQAPARDSQIFDPNPFTWTTPDHWNSKPLLPGDETPKNPFKYKFTVNGQPTEPPPSPGPSHGE